MKLFTLISAGLVAIAAIAPAAASAQMQTHERHDKVVRTTTTVRTDGDRRDTMRSDRHRGWRDRHHTRRVCRNEWRHHHRVRVCRTVRW